MFDCLFSFHMVLNIQKRGEKSNKRSENYRIDEVRFRTNFYCRIYVGLRMKNINSRMVIKTYFFLYSFWLLVCFTCRIPYTVKNMFYYSYYYWLCCCWDLSLYLRNEFFLFSFFFKLFAYFPEWRVITNCLRFMGVGFHPQ